MLLCFHVFISAFGQQIDTELEQSDRATDMFNCNYIQDDYDLIQLLKFWF